MKKLILSIAALILLAGAFLLARQVLWPDRLERMSIKDLDVDLSLSGVNLSQGKDGRKLWNLNATGADYAEADDQLTLTNPIIVYWDQNNTDPIQVMAPRGQIWQKEDRARMWDGVNATQGEYTMQARTLNYAGQERTLVLDGDVQVRSTTLNGQADLLTYFLDTGDFLAQGNVRVVMN